MRFSLDYFFCCLTCSGASILQANPKVIWVRIKMVLTFHNSKKLANILLQNFSVMQLLKKQRLGLRNLPDCKIPRKFLRKKSAENMDLSFYKTYFIFTAKIPP